MVIGSLISATVHALEVLMTLLLQMVNWGVEAVSGLADFEQSQPVAVLFVVGGVLAVFVLTPIVMPLATGQDFNWNHVIFGQSLYSEITPETDLFLSEMDDEALNEILDDAILVRVDPNASATRRAGGQETKRIYFGANDQELNIDFQVMSWAQGMIDIDNAAYNYCGSSAYNGTSKNSTVWEVLIQPKQPGLKERLKASVGSPIFRLQEVTFSCYGIATLPTEEITIPGSSHRDKRGNLSAMLANGSICADAPLVFMSKEYADPSTPTGFIYSLANYPLIKSFSRAFASLTDLIFNFDRTQTTPTSPIGCYLIASNETRQRYYASVPTWLVDTGESANLWAWMLYGFKMAVPPRVLLEDWQTIESIQVAVPLSHTPGIISPIQAPYEQAKATTNSITLDMTKDYWDTFELAITVIIMILIGVAGVVLVLSAQNIIFK